MKSLYGLTRPYDFNRALPFIVAVLLLSATLGILAGAALLGKVSWGSDRLVYFLYLGSLALAAAVLSFAPVLAWLLCALCFIELFLGVGTFGLDRLGLMTRTSLPIDRPISEPTSEALRFRYHPLLQGTSKPDFARSLPFEITHDSQGLRGAERDRKDLASRVVVATLGGSTTYGIGAANGETWSDALERRLGRGFAVLNHGVPGYSTVENLIQTLFYLDAYGVRPACAVYYLGWNDIRNAHLPDLDPAFADFHLPSQRQNLQLLKREPPRLARFSPLGRLAFDHHRAWTRAAQLAPAPERFDDRSPVSGSDLRLEAFFRANLTSIVAQNEQRGIATIFVGQVLNRNQLRGETRYGWLPLVRDGDV